MAQKHRGTRTNKPDRLRETFWRPMITQRQKVLDLLIEAKDRGVNSYDLTYYHSIKQAPTRVKELREQGYNITSFTLPNRSVNYVLVEVPLKDRPFKWDFSQGSARKVYV